MCAPFPPTGPLAVSGVFEGLLEPGSHLAAAGWVIQTDPKPVAILVEEVSPISIRPVELVIDDRFDAYLLEVDVDQAVGRVMQRNLSVGVGKDKQDIHD